MIKIDRATVILAALVRARTPGNPAHLVRRAIEMADLVEMELERREPYEFEPLTVPPWESSRVH